jgi:hypothetical protein
MKHESKGMMDNHKVSDSHQEGISRVMQKSHEKREGHFGKMGLHHESPHKDAHKHTEHLNEHFKRSRGNKTPAQA